MTLPARGRRQFATPSILLCARMVKEGFYFGIPPLAIGLAALFARWTISGMVLCLVGVFVFSFFRDPERAVPQEEGAIVAPADGKVLVVTDEENSGRPGRRISIFLAIWNVHVNRSPASGTITRLDYRPGKFLAAWDPKASLQNEQNVFGLATSAGELEFKQIAGWVARRVVSWKKAGDVVARGERIGLVRFGSRVDLWVPREAELLVNVGENVKGGSSILARWPVSKPESKAERNLTGVGRFA